MIFKSFIIEKKIELLDAYNLTLIYGENEGIKTILREKIKNRNNNGPEGVPNMPTHELTL